ncbi:radical SAM protein [Acidocella sp.]|uniref:radical SAM protein n=1 Tax=Acidocella sp. TaxID=50710 RepID=UPI002637663C|nr:radical SAM protein [Acidocella sp.]
MSIDATAYDATRDFSRKAVRSLCYAPHSNLFFDRQGRVRACCFNWSEPLGNLTSQTLDEIWSGAQAALMRAALERYELPAGCAFCRFQTDQGWMGGAKMRQFDHFAVTETPPRWPGQMEFSLSNACNIECAMCDGEHSSAIRAHREGLPAQPRLYSDEMLEQFRPYLPHLTQAKFLGGEPFLATENFKIWEMMIEEGPQGTCHATTNGTQYNARIERVLERLRFGFALSLDGARRETIERVRYGAKYDEVMRNVRRFIAYTRARGTGFTLTYCLMRPNWAEFGEFCALADSLGVRASLNTVLRPPGYSLYTLPASELRRVVTALERQAPELETSLTLNKSVWFDELERLRRKCVAMEAATAPPPPLPRVHTAPLTTPHHAIVLGIETPAQASHACINLHMLRSFSHTTLVAAAGGCESPDAQVTATDPLSLRTGLFDLLPSHIERALYIGADQPPPRHDIDRALERFAPPLAFARAGRMIDEASATMVRCGCTGASCPHAREALLCLLGADVTDCAWALPDPSRFAATRAALPLLAAWRDYAQQAAANNYWADPVLAGLIAMLWHRGLAHHPPLA